MGGMLLPVPCLLVEPGDRLEQRPDDGRGDDLAHLTSPPSRRRNCVSPAAPDRLWSIPRPSDAQGTRAPPAGLLRRSARSATVWPRAIASARAGAGSR